MRCVHHRIHSGEVYHTDQQRSPSSTLVESDTTFDSPISPSGPKSLQAITLTLRSFCTFPIISTAWLSWRCASCHRMQIVSISAPPCIPLLLLPLICSILSVLSTRFLPLPSHPHPSTHFFSLLFVIWMRYSPDSNSQLHLHPHPPSPAPRATGGLSRASERCGGRTERGRER